MKALVYHGMRDVRVDTMEDIKIEYGRDVTILVTSTAIRGFDLHIYNGRLPQLRPMVLGHEFMGTVEEVDKGLGNEPKVGNRVVVVPFPIACGTCFFYEHDLPGHYENSNLNHYGPEGGLLTEKGRALFGHIDLSGG